MKSSITLAGAGIFMAMSLYSCQKQIKPTEQAAASTRVQLLTAKPGGDLQGTVAVFATGLNNPRGLKFGPDGNLYVAEGGLGGTHSTVGQCEQAPFPVTVPMKLGVIPMGLADGLAWLHAGRVLVRGRAVPILTGPNLEHTRIDLTSVPDARVSDEVVIIGRQGDDEITIAEVAKRHGLGLHHVATTVGPRVTRVYRSAAATSPA